jgi:hypothetical protein
MYKRISSEIHKGFGLRPGSAVEMNEMGNMTAYIFVKWLPHMAKCKFSGPFKLLRDGAVSHPHILVVDGIRITK